VVGGDEGEVDQGLWQARVADEGQEPGLELAARPLGVVAGGGVGEGSCSSVPVRPCDQVCDRSLVVELQALGLRQRPLQAVRLDRRGQVQQRPRDFRDRDPFVLGGVTGIEGTRPMQANALATVAATRRGHIDQRRLRREQPPMRRRTAMTQHRALPGEPRRQPPPLTPQDSVPDRIHPAMQPTQPPDTRALLHRTRPQSQRTQLRQRHHPKLPLSQLRQRDIRGPRYRWGPLKRNNSPQTPSPHCPGSAAPRARVESVSARGRSSAWPRAPRAGRWSSTRCSARATGSRSMRAPCPWRRA
jgi:hypothetical protein